ncbi:hypothetical protein DL546_002131 [Coniochaeta pulveracea]|uniref:Uncharacterized protein n=1 Tax=Coniochaeta pulveracea TaxID=177199 RepID=A0A420YDZ8_9PEZI|nr:hypothetical protein DL546_002131 [Coniochaeta pulveracea]
MSGDDNVGGTERTDRIVNCGGYHPERMTPALKDVPPHNETNKKKKKKKKDLAWAGRHVAECMCFPCGAFIPYFMYRLMNE